MRRTALALLLVLVVAVAASGRTSAGGWATVRLDEPVPEVAAGVPFRFGFTIRAHDINPIDVARATVFARSRDGKTSLTADAARTGDVGRYVAELTLPSAGGWKWGVSAGEPWGEMAFETLTVAAQGSVAASDALSRGAFPEPWTGVVSRGTCTDPGELKPAAAVSRFPVEVQGVATVAAVADPLSTVPISVPAVPTFRGASTIPVALPAVTTTEHVVLVERPGRGDATVIACGEVRGSPIDGELAIGLVEQGGSGYLGIALLRAKGDRSDVTVYLLPARPPTAGTVAEVTIDDAAFSPPALSIPVGTTVVWRNEGTIAHTVMGSDLSFADSAVLDPGQEFVQTFDTPGTYAYLCGPHPNMTGTITVV